MRLALVALVLMFAGGLAGASDFVAPPHPLFKGDQVRVDERLQAQVPLHLKFFDHDGVTVSLADVLSGELPTILTFNYSDCPMLCNLQLSGLVKALQALGEGKPLTAAQAQKIGSVQRPVAFRVGPQFRIVTVVLEPKQPLAKTAKMRTSYLERLPAAMRERAGAGWTFLSATADDPAGSAIAQLADSVGFRYVYLKERAEWAHPAALIFLSSAGKVTRYVYGNEFADADLRDSLLGAGLNEPSTAAGFMTRCYHFDPSESDRSWVAVWALRLGGLLFLLVGASVAVWRTLRTRVRRGAAGGDVYT